MVRDLFARQAIPMTLGLCGGKPVRQSSRRSRGQCWVSRQGPRRLPADAQAWSARRTHQPRTYDGVLISTDPPYYDNIGYSDLSDFFYVWLRRTLVRSIPTCFARCWSRRPKSSSPIPTGTTARTGRRSSSRTASVSLRARARIRDADFPITVYYAFKQSDSDDRRGVDGLGDPARRHDPVRLDDHGHVADAEPNSATGCSARHQRARSSIVLSLRPRPGSRRPPTVVASSPPPGRASRRAAQAPAGPDRAGRPAAGGHRAGHGGVQPLQRRPRDRRLAR